MSDYILAAKHVMIFMLAASISAGLGFCLYSITDVVWVSVSLNILMNFHFARCVVDWINFDVNFGGC